VALPLTPFVACRYDFSKRESTAARLKAFEARLAFLKRKPESQPPDWFYERLFEIVAKHEQPDTITTTFLPLVPNQPAAMCGLVSVRLIQ